VEQLPQTHRRHKTGTIQTKGSFATEDNQEMEEINLFLQQLTKVRE